MMDWNGLLHQAAQMGASDLLLIANTPVSFRVDGELVQEEEAGRPTPADTARLAQEACVLAGYEENRAGCVAFSLAGHRCRVCIYQQQASVALAVRMLSFDLTTPDAYGIPDTILELADCAKGLVLVTGPAGCGKFSTLACMAAHISQTHAAHLVTLEQPIKYLLSAQDGVVSQREVGADVSSYAEGLRAALLQSPDVVLIDRLPEDPATIALAMDVAESGRLVLATMPTTGAVNTIERILDAFPTEQQRRARSQLSLTLQAVVSQLLLPAAGGGVVPAFEIMLANNTVRSMIRESKVYQIDTVIYSSAREGMEALDNSLLTLFRDGRICAADVLSSCLNPEVTSKKLL